MKAVKRKNKFIMWPKGPELELPWGYHWDIGTQQVVMDEQLDGFAWRGSLSEFFDHQKSLNYNPQDEP